MLYLVGCTILTFGISLQLTGGSSITKVPQILFFFDLKLRLIANSKVRLNPSITPHIHFMIISHIPKTISIQIHYPLS